MADIYIGNVKGPQGETGATGAQGPQGDAATIEVGTVSTTAYGNTAQVINTGTSSEAVFDFVIPQGRPGEETTTMSSLTLDTVTAQSAQYPIPATGESGSVVFGKIIKFFNDVKSAIVSKINYSDCVYNLTSTSNTLPLAASQGKALNDAITPLNAAERGNLTVSGTSSFRLDDARYVRVGKSVTCAIRGTYTGSTSQGTSVPLVKMPFKQINNSGPCVAQIGSNVYMNGAMAVTHDNVWYLHESVTGSLSANTIIGIYYTYITDGTVN